MRILPPSSAEPFCYDVTGVQIIVIGCPRLAGDSPAAIRNGKVCSVYRLVLAAAPACVTFGPVFMVMGGGRPFERLVMFAGAVLLGGGLAAMFKIISNQQKLIERLQNAPRSIGEPELN